MSERERKNIANNTSEISTSQIINAPDEVIEVNDSVNYTRPNPTTDVNVAINSGIPNNGFQRPDRQNKPTAQLNNLSSFEARIPKHLVPCPFLRTSNPNNLINPRSDPLPVNPIHRSCHFVPSIILANAMSLSPKIDEIRLYVQDHVPDIMCFTETWLKDTVENSVIHITNYTLVRKDRIYAQHRGVCLYIKDTIPFTVLREYERDTSIEVLWCKLSQTTSPRLFLYNGGLKWWSECKNL